MFGVFRERRARAAMALVVGSVGEGVGLLSPVDRAATMAIANALLSVAAEHWGRVVVERPQALSGATAATIVNMLAESHGKALSALKAYGDRGMGDATYSQAMRQVRATEVAMGAVGRRFTGPEGVREVNGAWKALWNARGMADEAATVLLRFTKVSGGADALPRTASRNGPYVRDDVVRLASTLPAMFRRPAPKPPTPPPAPASAKGRARPPSAPPRGPRGAGAPGRA